MFELRIEVDFPAAHQLHGYQGDCAKPHGHNWVMEVFARSKGLDSVGMGIDFRLLKRAAKEVIAPWDHCNLNELPEFKNLNPTAENIAKLAYEKLSAVLNSTGGGSWIDRVTIWENPRCYASYLGPAK